MAEPQREELRVQQQTAILVGVIEPGGSLDKDHALDELRGLAKTAGVKIAATLVQSRSHPDPATMLGSGKIDELKQLVDMHDAEVVIFDNNLTPAQGRNLEKELETVIVDRSELILDIFASRARSHEARLQVELAQLLYFRTRLKRMWTHLERIEGGSNRSRGPGEKQIETDRRLIGKRVSELKKRLKEVERRRQRTVSNRGEWSTVSLVGYTNAGKSTLMNALTGSDVYVADKLFATLDTRTRRWEIPNWGEALLSDTVGFVRDLPHHLVASFRSTLEEARHADLLLHVVDASNPEAELQIATVNSVLEEIGVDCNNMLLVLNKVDAVQDRSIVDVLRARHENAVTVSAATGEGLERVAKAAAERLGEGYLDAEIEGSVANGRLVAFIGEHAHVEHTDYSDSRVTFHCRIPRQFLRQLPGEDTTFRILDHGELSARRAALAPTPPSLPARRDGEGAMRNGDARGNGSVKSLEEAPQR